MYTNTSCTIYSYNGSGYDTISISACYLQEVKANEVKKYGAELADSVKVIIPLYALGGYKTSWDIPPGSYIAEGSPAIAVTDDISPLVDAGLAYYIKSVTDNRRGSQAVQHITIGAG